MTPPWPVPTIGSNISIRDFLQNVNDNLGKPYINSDVTPNYGIYFGDNKTGGVMYIGDHPRSCGKDPQVISGIGRLVGSPPLVRERLRLSALRFFYTGITPARAGKTQFLSADTASRRDHPRSCGKDFSSCEVRPCPLGSPPLVRERRTASTST